MRMLPADRPPIHPGEMLLEEYLKPLGITQSSFADKIGVSFPRLNEVIKGRRGVTPDTALRLSQALETSPDMWLTMQLDWDLWHAMRSPAAKAIRRIKPVQVTVA